MTKPGKKPNPLRGAALAVLVLLIYPPTRSMVGTDIASVAGFTAGARVTTSYYGGGRRRL